MVLPAGIIVCSKRGGSSDDLIEDDFFGDGEEAGEGSITLNYIDLPLIARYYLSFNT